MAKSTNPWQTLPPWIGAEGSQNGLPLLIRLREFPEGVLAHPLLPILIRVYFVFTMYDQSGLPTDEQYDLIDAFERRTLDKIEGMEQGLTAFIKTFNGAVRYVIYAKDFESVQSTIFDSLLDEEKIEIESTLDDQWDAYRKLRAMVE